MAYWQQAKQQELIPVNQVVVKTAGRGLGDAWSASASFESPLLVAGVAYDKAIPSPFLGRGS